MRSFIVVKKVLEFIGLEPTAKRLQSERSTNWAKTPEHTKNVDFLVPFSFTAYTASTQGLSVCGRLPHVLFEN